jgi:Tfp pilus assembly protein PilV
MLIHLSSSSSSSFSSVGIVGSMYDLTDDTTNNTNETKRGNPASSSFTEGNHSTTSNTTATNISVSPSSAKNRPVQLVQSSHGLGITWRSTSRGSTNGSIYVSSCIFCS